jgi:hypothetical protein
VGGPAGYGARAAAVAVRRRAALRVALLCAVIAPSLLAMTGVAQSVASHGVSPGRAVTAAAPCEWQVSGTWQTQTLPFHPVFTLAQQGTDVSGTETFPPADAAAAGFPNPTATVTGTLNGDQIDIVATFQGVLKAGRRAAGTLQAEYKGTVTSGSVSGTGQDITTPNTATVPWTGSGPTQCLAPSTPPGCGATAASAKPWIPVCSMAAPSGWGTTATAPAPSPGGNALVESPPLANTNTVTANVTGISPDDLATLTDLRHQCWTNFHSAVVLAGGIIIKHWAGISLFLSFAREFVHCVHFVDALQAALATQATAATAQAACAFTPVQLSITGSGATARLRSFHFGAPAGTRPSLRVSCRRTAAGLTLTVKSNSPGTPLRSIVGPRLRIAISRSPRDRTGGQLGVTFQPR